MIKHHRRLLTIFLILIAASLACRRGAREQIVLGEEHRSEEGGFILQKIPDYDFESFVNLVIMTAPDALPETGPMIMIEGGLIEEEMNIQDLFEALKHESEGVVIGDGEKVTVDGIDGLLADLSGNYGGEPISGRLFVAMSGPKQEFMMIGMAPEARWGELSPIFDAVLESVRFIEAQPLVWLDDDAEVDIPDVMDEPVEDELVVEEPALVVSEVIRQWAIYAEASSEYTSTDWSAMQATGEPDVAECGDDRNAWASRYPDTEDYLILVYETPVNPTELTIYQSYNPSQVVEIQFIDVEGETWLLWYGEPEEVPYCPDVWTHTIELDEVFYTNTVVIFIDQSILGLGWAEIDAVELVGYRMESQVVSPVEIDEPPAPTETQPAVVVTEEVPSNYEGMMAGPVYQGWINIVINETKESDLDRIMTIEGRKSTDSWKPRDTHAQTYLFDMPWEGMTGYISVTTDGFVYKKNVNSTAHPTDFALDSVNRENYDSLRAIYNENRTIAYSVVANMLESPGFIREQYIREDDGKIFTIYNWYNAAGDRITGTFTDGFITGLGLNYIEAP